MDDQRSELLDQLAGLVEEAEALRVDIEDYQQELAQRWGGGSAQQEQAPTSGSGTPLPNWWGPDYPGHPAFEDPVEKGHREAFARQREPIIRDTSGAPLKPAGWDEPDEGNPYSPAFIEQRRRDHEREVAENREADRKAEQELNSPEYRGLTT